jgi:hypothetical protein
VGVLELYDALDATDELDDIPVDFMMSVTTVIPLQLGGITWNNSIVAGPTIR